MHKLLKFKILYWKKIMETIAERTPKERNNLISLANDLGEWHDISEKFNRVTNTNSMCEMVSNTVSSGTYNFNAERGEKKF